jgi:glycosyltransferase involved in cell wall biosynthesis
MTMRVLSLSLDTELLHEKSAVAVRIASYGAFVDLMDVVVPAAATTVLALAPNVTVYGSGGKYRFVQFFRVLYKAFLLMRAREHGVVTSQDAYFLGLISSLCARFGGAGFEVQAHGIEKDSYLRSILAGFIYRRANVVRVVSTRLRTELMGRYSLSAERFAVIPIFVNTDDLVLTEKNKYRTQYKNLNQINLVSIGRLVPVKNHMLQLEALVALKDTFPHTHLHIVGEGPLHDALVRHADSLGVAHMVTFHGNPEREVIGGLLLSSDIFIHTAHSEGYGMVFIEALKSGITIVSTDVGSIDEYKDAPHVYVTSRATFTETLTSCMSARVSKAKRENIVVPTRAEIASLYKNTWSLINTKK